MSQKKEVAEMTQKERYRYIRSLMVREGITNAEIAERAKCRREYVYLVMTEQRKGYRIRRVIAEAVGLKENDIWPEQRRAA
jgi:lambda repressor-like predicted transcriptional regulator